MLIRNQVASMVRDRQHFQTKPLTAAPAAVPNQVHAADEAHPATLTAIPSQQNHVANGQASQPVMASQSAAPTITNIQTQHVSKSMCEILTRNERGGMRLETTVKPKAESSSVSCQGARQARHFSRVFQSDACSSSSTVPFIHCCKGFFSPFSPVVTRGNWLHAWAAGSQLPESSIL